MLGKVLLTVCVNGFEIEINNEEKAPGIDFQEAETTNTIDEIIDRIKELETNYETKTEALKADKNLGEDARLKAMEPFAETKKRKGESEETSPFSSKRRRLVNDTEYLKEIGHRKEERNEQEMDCRKIS